MADEETSPPLKRKRGRPRKIRPECVAEVPKPEPEKAPEQELRECAPVSCGTKGKRPARGIPKVPIERIRFTQRAILEGVPNGVIVDTLRKRYTISSRTARKYMLRARNNLRKIGAEDDDAALHFYVNSQRSLEAYSLAREKRDYKAMSLIAYRNMNVFKDIMLSNVARPTQDPNCVVYLPVPIDPRETIPDPEEEDGGADGDEDAGS